ncbi:MAG: hypothetical protein QCI00_06875 [Candidatus Thermoplasmatota archaeon]|nr:hypothetical protein [Candidatus Thermoplasmatota archaeon]
MKKTAKIVVCLMTLMFLSSILATSSDTIQIIQIEEKSQINELDEIGTPITINRPKIGYLHVFGTRIHIPFLETIGWSVVIDSALCVETTGAEEADYVEFTVLQTIGNISSEYVEQYTKLVYDYPFHCCFDDLPTSFYYNITATAYHNETVSSTDSVYPVAFIKSPALVTHD